MNSNNSELVEKLNVIWPDEKTIEAAIKEIGKSDILKLEVGTEAIPITDAGGIVVDYMSCGTKLITFQIKKRSKK